MSESGLFPLYGQNIARAGAYHGWTMAETVWSRDEEYLAAKYRVACFDSSFRGRLALTGKDALDLLHRLSTNDLLDLRPGESAGTVLVTEKGRIIDFVTVFNAGERLLLIVSPGAAERVSSWIGKFVILEDVLVKDVTVDTVMVSFIGPEADSFISSLFQIHSPNPPVLSLPWGDVQVIPARYSTASEVHIVARAENAGRLWAWLEGSCGLRLKPDENRSATGIPMIGSAAYEAYRITEGIPMAGTELVEGRNPYDVNLKSFISYTKGCYIGQEVIARLDTYQKVRRRMAGVVVDAGFAPVVSGVPVWAGGDEAGWLTSVTGEVVFGARLGLAVLRNEVISDGGTVTWSSGGGEASASVYELPMRWPRA